jgi:hypothetical protein
MNLAFAQEDRNRFNLLLLPTSRVAMQKLQKSCRLWTQQSLRSTIQDISRQYGISIWLDRQIDPNQTVSMGSADQDSTLGRELARLASESGNCGGLVENVYLIAPPDRLARIQRAAVALHGQITSLQSETDTRQQILDWPDISSSNEILDRIRTQWDVSVDHELPHDLFYAFEFPKSTLATQVSLLLGAFDCQARLIRGKPVSQSNSDQTLDQSASTIQLSVQPLSTETHWQDIYADSLLSKRKRSPPGAELSQTYPGSSIRLLPDQRLAVNAETNVHVDILSLQYQSPGRQLARSGKSTAKKYSFSTDEPLPVEAILTMLSQNFAVRIEWSEDCSPADRNRLTQLRIENASQQELLQKVCEDAQLQLNDLGDRILISPKK